MWVLHEASQGGTAPAAELTRHCGNCRSQGRFYVLAGCRQGRGLPSTASSPWAGGRHASYLAGGLHPRMQSCAVSMWADNCATWSHQGMFQGMFPTGSALRRPGLMAAAEELQRGVVSVMAIQLISTWEDLTDDHAVVFKAASQLRPAAAGALRRVRAATMRTGQHGDVQSPGRCCVRAASSC